MAIPYSHSISPADFATGIQSQIPSINAVNATWRLQHDPFANILGSGTFPANAGESIRTVVPTQYVSGFSLTSPQFVAKKGSCGTAPTAGKFGQTEYTTSIKRARGKLPNICVNDAFYSVENSFKMGIQTARDMIFNLNLAHARAELVAMSGTKIKVQSSTFLANVSGGTTSSVAVGWTAGLPQYSISHKFLTYTANYVRETLHPDFFGSGATSSLRGVFGLEAVEAMRNQSSVQADLLAFTQGNFKDAKDALQKYSWAEYPYRGLQIGIDPQPLRYNTVDGSGNPVWIEPLVEVVADSGSAMETNPAWVNAKYEVGFLFGNNAVNRLVPERYTGEGDMKFDPQDYAGELFWHYVKDMGENMFGDFGSFLYQIEDAYQPVKPHTIIPVSYKRCVSDLGLISCDGLSGSESL